MRYHIKDDIAYGHYSGPLMILNKRNIIALVEYMADFQWTSLG